MIGEIFMMEEVDWMMNYSRHQLSQRAGEVVVFEVGICLTEGLGRGDGGSLHECEVEIPDRPEASFAVCEVLEVTFQPHHGPWVDTQVRTVEAQLLNDEVIPRQVVTAVVQFYISASDTLGGTSTFPTGGLDLRVLMKIVDSLTATNGWYNFRVILTNADCDRILQGRIVFFYSSLPQFFWVVRLRSPKRRIRNSRRRAGW